MKRSYRRQRNPQKQTDTQKAFFSGSGSSLHAKRENSEFFPPVSKVQKQDAEQEEMDASVQPMLQKQESEEEETSEGSTIQKLSTPEEDESLGTAEQRMEKDRAIQEKPDVQMQEESEDEPAE